MTTKKVYCPCCGRFIGDYSSSDESSVVKTTMEKPKQSKKQSCYITNICKKCKSEIYIHMEFEDSKTNEQLLAPGL